MAEAGSFVGRLGRAVIPANYATTVAGIWLLISEFGPKFSTAPWSGVLEIFEVFVAAIVVHVVASTVLSIPTFGMAWSQANPGAGPPIADGQVVEVNAEGSAW